MSVAQPALVRDDVRALDHALAAVGRVHRALKELPGAWVLSSSFGVQSAVMLHMVTRQVPDIPVIVIDTGYLFPETYRFIETLQRRLDVNLHVARPRLSPGWLESVHGKLWEQGREGLARYNRLAKVEPMEQALRDLDARTWFSGLRRRQARTRSHARFVEFSRGRYKVHPIADWSNRDVGRYLKQHDLPWHPLFDQGYVSIGDTHTTRRWQPGMRE